MANELFVRAVTNSLSIHLKDWSWGWDSLYSFHTWDIWTVPSDGGSYQAHNYVVRKIYKRTFAFIQKLVKFAKDFFCGWFPICITQYTNSDVHYVHSYNTAQMYVASHLSYTLCLILKNSTLYPHSNTLSMSKGWIVNHSRKTFIYLNIPSRVKDWYTPAQVESLSIISRSSQKMVLTSSCGSIWIINSGKILNTAHSFKFA